MTFDFAILLFWLKKTVSALVLPPSGPLLLITVGLLLLIRWRRTGLTLAWAGLALALLLSSPASVGLLLRGLEADQPVSMERAREAQAIVILGGGKRTHAPEYGTETLNRFSLERVRYGAHLARLTGLPILVTGGTLRGTFAEADLMQAALENEFDVPVRWVESAARDTRENARYSAVHLEAAGVERILLVSHAAHLPRAQSEFETLGFEVVPAPTAWFGGPASADAPPNLLPSATSAFAGWVAAHEWVGRLAYRLTR